MISGSSQVDSDLGWMRTHIRAEDPPVTIREVTTDYAVIGLCGPRARDVLAADNPYEARLGFCVKMNAGDFIGRQALIRNKAENSLQRLYTLVIGDEEYLTLYGGEAVLSDGKVISRLRSAGYGHTIKKNIGFVYLPVDMAGGKPRLEVEIFGETVTAEVAADILYDPEGNALRK